MTHNIRLFLMSYRAKQEAKHMVSIIRKNWSLSEIRKLKVLVKVTHN